MFRIAKDTPGLVRKAGGKWHPHKATKDLVFETARPHKGGYLVFSRGSWEFMVLDRHARGGYQAPPAANKLNGFGTFNRCVLGRNGRGASRRRAMRRRRSR